MDEFKHLIEIDGESRSIKVFRVYDGGEKELYTEADLPEMDENYEKFKAFAQSLGESILCDSATVRAIYDL